MIQTYGVKGMTCEHCVHAVQAELGALPGVSEVVVELVPGGTSTAHVTSTQPLEEADVTTALDEAGDYRLA